MKRLENHRGRWTPEEDSQLRTMFAQGFVLKDVSRALQRSQEAVRTRAALLRISVTSGPRRTMARTG